MKKVLLIETSTALCSVAMASYGENGSAEIIGSRQSSEPKAHASLTAVFAKELIDLAGGCDAVCVSMGPGSYTGLRVGVSSAKGICFGAKIPLLAVGTLDTLCHQGLAQAIELGCRHIVPMIDARRMEAYTAVFEVASQDATGAADGSDAFKASVCRQITPTEPKIVDSESWADLLEQGPVLFIGDAAEKCSKVITHPNAHFIQCHPHANSMMTPAKEALSAGKWQDVAYFEPFYLKEFVATTSKKRLF